MPRRSGSALVAAIGLALLSIVAVDSARLIGEVFPGFLTWDNGTLVSFQDAAWTGASSGLPINGGRVVAVEGQPFQGGRPLLAHARALPAGTPVSYRVLYEGQERVFRIETMTLSGWDYATTFGVYLVGAALFFAIAVMALYLRPDQSAARTLGLLMILVGALMALALDFLCSYRFPAVMQLVEAATPAAVIHLALVFPAQRLSTARHRPIVTALYVAALAIGAANVFLFRRDPETARAITDGVYLLIAATLLGLLASLAHALRTAATPVDRMRAAVVFSGGLISGLLPAVAIPAFLLLGWSFNLTWVFGLLAFFPISILYAVVRYDLLEAERFIRLSLGYSVATSALVLVYAVSLFTIQRLFSPEASAHPAAAVFVLLAASVIFDPVRRTAQTVVDRWFFRTELDIGRVLEESGADLVGMAGEEQIRDHIERRARDALSLEWAYLAGFDDPTRPGEFEQRLDFFDEPLGVLVCGAKRSGAPFSAVERELVQGLAYQAALAIHNARSIRALTESQAALLRSEQLAAVGELAGSVAHGIRNPLSSIRAAAQIAREETKEPGTKESLTSVIEESDRLEARVRSLLDFSRPFDPRPSTAPLAPLLDSVVLANARLAEQQNVSVRVETSEAPSHIEVDPVFLEEALLELVANALHAMPEGGELELAAKRDDHGTAILVSDTGSGIPLGIQDRIFELFYTTRPSGTGMGLATVKKIVERLGGRVALESSDPSGTRFRITLP